MVSKLFLSPPSSMAGVSPRLSVIGYRSSLPYCYRYSDVCTEKRRNVTQWGLLRREQVVHSQCYLTDAPSSGHSCSLCHVWHSSESPPPPPLSPHPLGLGGSFPHCYQVCKGLS